ncbi:MULTISPECIES: glycosyltransferase family 4 protein [unclassified Sphingomonas]|uniref:glycosyltransferase family 4 protein n=1 Tax=unclassified Sphingomonas TaxID=196159 RepID=UPI0006FDFAD2|nr:MULTISPECIES: glycosyltransferase family 4 protein [unclassified Sphingomonas]KQX21737.1 glycosyl transferase family 1 [Sphingomonas sp. Root1294]KQY73052.1 glycosyl transferase family 1 [Sphingomonas sp. Root50]KRB88411.1 glycosyl transferase family 1 [Sphingomonas sp. Root720]
MQEQIRSIFETGGDQPSLSRIRHIAVIGNALPRRCGLATFTSHVVDALHARFPDLIVDHYAMDDGSGVAYPDGVRTIPADDPAGYRLAAGLIEASGAQAIWLQHEFGIFGGEAGDHILRLVERSTLPLIATLHTVLETPSPAERTVFEALLRRASHLIVMAERGRRILQEVYGVEAERIAVIPHGVPDRAYVDPEAAKAALGFAGRKIVMTFGLLAPDKGIDVMIDAMPAIVAAHPECCYLVIGATHPNLVRERGEAHREALAARAEALGVARHIRFIDAFLEQEDLLDWLEACDVYVTPYLNMAQITSGTLSYAIGLGKPVVSTPYLHAVELLADGHGVLVPPRDSEALADAVNALLGDDEGRDALAQRAYGLGRRLLWPKAVERALALIGSADEIRPRAHLFARKRVPSVPQLGALMRMTDATGLYQHGIHTIPDRNHGYCIDDNARALILTCRIEGGDRDAIARLASTYAAFVHHGWNADRGRFRNFMGFDRRWCEDEGSEDSNGRTLWALGCAAAHGTAVGIRDWAAALFGEAAPLADALVSPRARAFAALGAAEMLSVQPGDARAMAILKETAELLKNLLATSRRPDWAWFEAVLAYDNARLPEALIRAGVVLGDRAAIDIGLETLEWICAVQTNARGAFRPVGTDSFHRPHAPPLPYDQQPLEAQATIDACVAAFAVTGDPQWGDLAWRAYGWFMGDNDLGLSLADGVDGGCFDGLMPHGVNRNQGAESILALQLANVAMISLSKDLEARKTRDAA